MYATVDGLAGLLGVTADELSQSTPRAERDLQGVESRIMAYIIPSSPRCEPQEEALASAVYAQYEYEQRPDAKEMMQIPGAVNSFSVGNFSVSMSNAGPNAKRLFPVGLSPDAQAILMTAGLLCKGGFVS